MFNQSDLKAYGANAVENAKAIKKPQLENALAEQRLKNEGTKAVIDTQEAGSTARNTADNTAKKGYYDSTAAVNNANAAGTTLENTLKQKTQPGLIAATNSASASDTFRNSLAQATAQTGAMQKGFSVSTANNSASVSDKVRAKYTNQMDAENEAAIKATTPAAVKKPTPITDELDAANPVGKWHPRYKKPGAWK